MKLVEMALRAELVLALTPPPIMEGGIASENQIKSGNVSYDIAQVNKTCPFTCPGVSSPLSVSSFLSLLPPLSSLLLSSPTLSLAIPAVHCVWEPWTDWTACSLPCGGGLQFQTREKQVEKYGGRPCEGPPVQNRTCNTHFCPSKGLTIAPCIVTTCWVPCS